MTDGTGGTEFVFVYGTLRQGFSNAGRDILELHGQLVGDATVEGTLYDLGSFPAMTEPASQGDRVVGEVYRLQHETETGLRRLDRYEGARGSSPLPYERRRTTVTMEDDSELTAWVYVWTDPVEGLDPVPDGDYVAHVHAQGG